LCNTKGKVEKCIQNFSERNLRGKDDPGNIGIDERIVLNWMFGK
jgi:hypothetical protein